MNIEAYPLHWPDGWKRTENQRVSQFLTSFADARDGLIDEIRKLGGSNVILSTNVELRKDGLPYSRKGNPEDSGVAVYFDLNGEPNVFACDRWIKVGDNVQAIRKTIDALRGIERWGSSEMISRLYKGFQALPEKSEIIQQDAWFIVLGVDPSATLDEIEKEYRKKSKTMHPDNGGSHEKMRDLNIAVQQARDEKS